MFLLFFSLFIYTLGLFFDLFIFVFLLRYFHLRHLENVDRSGTKKNNKKGKGTMELREREKQKAVLMISAVCAACLLLYSISMTFFFLLFFFFFSN
ncbi:hypothetical protein STCU_11396 [Strigomonas culicis]|uniref:Uncharacterized protein n=1 Tax=Strigomonas culicis TaxID=28005 RepID=S9UNS3_9TRYP|nr:hypothetical protein STCU_11396 [Strigomonas culicis]|eukprot:EPY16326.1 hypothetical protein STCU_11396 [Strigomonas culicis]